MIQDSLLSTAEFEDFVIIKEKINSALSIFIDNDIDLIKLDVDERSITHKIAHYLEDFFPEWDIDCEYNRDRDKIKKRFDDITLVRPDIIIHKRNISNNLLIIEVKKSHSNFDFDRKKIKEFISSNWRFGYKYGLLLIIDQHSEDIFYQEWYFE
jgi:hypothetical protein